MIIRAEVTAIEHRNKRATQVHYRHKKTSWIMGGGFTPAILSGGMCANIVYRPN